MDMRNISKENSARLLLDEIYGAEKRSSIGWLGFEEETGAKKKHH